MTGLRRLLMRFKRGIEISETANNARFALDLLSLRRFSEEAFHRSGYTLGEAMAGLGLGERVLVSVMDTLRRLTGGGGEPDSFFLEIVEELMEGRRATCEQLLREIKRGISELERVRRDPGTVSEAQTVYELLTDICSVLLSSSLRDSERLNRT